MLRFWRLIGQPKMAPPCITRPLAGRVKQGGSQTTSQTSASSAIRINIGIGATSVSRFPVTLSQSRSVIKIDAATATNLSREVLIAFSKKSKVYIAPCGVLEDSRICEQSEA